MSDSLSDIDLMKIAIEEQDKSASFPKVGVVIAKDGKVLSTAFRAEDRKHAERAAIEKLDPSSLKGATIVTTLEPCVEIRDDQVVKSCTDLIVDLEIREVIIGVLDPNGQIYCEGFERLLAKGVKVSFFTPDLREIVESKTFKYGDVGIGFGPSGKRRVAVLGSGKNFEIRFSRTDARSIAFRWQALQFGHGIVDLVYGLKGSVRDAKGAKSFDQISDPLVFRETSHFSRMKVGDIAVIYPEKGPFIILIKLLEITTTDIFFQWQVREVV